MHLYFSRTQLLSTTLASGSESIDDAHKERRSSLVAALGMLLWEVGARVAKSCKRCHRISWLIDAGEYVALSPGLRLELRLSFPKLS